MKIHRQNLSPFALLLGVSLAAIGSGAWALDCPTPQPLGAAAGVAPDLSKQLASKDVLGQIPGILGALHEKYPAASKPQLVNYLISAYCPVVNANAALSDQEKQARVKEFADRVVATEY